MDFPFISTTPVIGFESYLTFYYHFFLRIPFQLFVCSSSLFNSKNTLLAVYHFSILRSASLVVVFNHSGRKHRQMKGNFAINPVSGNFTKW